MKSFLESKYRDHAVAAALWLTVFLVYLQTIARTVGFIDSGELATVPYVLGIAHPTGYPLWTLVTHIFSHLPIAKEEIVRLNIFCALVDFIRRSALFLCDAPAVPLRDKNKGPVSIQSYPLPSQRLSSHFPKHSGTKRHRSRCTLFTFSY